MSGTQCFKVALHSIFRKLEKGKNYKSLGWTIKGGKVHFPKKIMTR